jgi:imidazolonepropionase
MPMMIALACLYMKMSPAAAICAATCNAAWAIDMSHEIGTLEPGKKADLILLDLENPEQLPYYFGTNPVLQVWKTGRKIFEQGQVLF